MHKYAVVFYPRGNLENIQSIRKKYDPKYKVIHPHITLVSPFADILEEEMMPHLSAIAKNFQPFPIRLSGLMKSFDDYLFLVVEDGNEAIRQLHDALYTGMLAKEHTQDIPFTPHITLGLFANNNALYQKAFKEAEDMQIDIHTTFDNFSLIKGDGDSAATVIQNFRLQKSL